MSEYFDVYRKRATHLGVTPQERAFKSGQLEFKKNLHYNQHTVRDLKCRDFYFDGVVLTDKQDQNRTSLILLTELSVEIKVGDLVEWDEKPWLIYKQVVSSYQPHNKFYMVKCDYVVNWIDKNGNLQSSAAHIVGSEESMLKGNYRNWHSAVTPQPNKFIEVLMPYHYIAKETEIILYDECWELIDYDRVSVPGTIFLSFTESKVNELRDSVYEQVANIDKLQKWSLNAPLSINVAIGDEIKPIYTLLKNGITTNEVATIIPGEKIFSDAAGKLFAAEEGETELLLTYDNIAITVKVKIGSAAPQGYIDGNDYIRVGRSGDYKLVLEKEPSAPISFTLDNEALASISSTSGAICSIKANDKNKLGKVILTASCGETNYTKEISIVSLWQEV